MKMLLQYLGRSETRQLGGGQVLSFAPNLARSRVFWNGELRDPLSFREAISALHEVVVGDLRFKRRDKGAYEQWKKQENERIQTLRRDLYSEAKKAEIAKIVQEPVPQGLEGEFRRMHSLYWTARRKWASELQRNDPELFRHLVPCDPVVTVAPDCVFFECFSKDESSYGCLYVDREAFGGQAEFGLGTTNVDYSLALYDHFQTLRTYHATRLLVDPSGFEVQVDGRSDYREEKIDLPPSWLRGFGQIQTAMAMPASRVRLSTETLYSIIAHLKRHREKAGPRSVRFKLRPGRPVVVVLDPWEIEIVDRSGLYGGPKEEEIKVWGRRRLLTLSRILPLADRIEVNLLGSGMPSIWTVTMGPMKMVLALSGWTTNDWTSSAAMDLMSATYEADAGTAARASNYLAEHHLATLSQLTTATGASTSTLLGSLHLLARQGQVIADPTTQAFRWRQVMPVALSEAVIGPDHPELLEGRQLFRANAAKVTREEVLAGGRRMIAASFGKTQCEGIVDPDFKFSKARCQCNYFSKNGLRGGPCRHLLALQLTLRPRPLGPTLASPASLH